MKAPNPLSGDPYMAMVVSLTAVATVYLKSRCAL